MKTRNCFGLFAIFGCTLVDSARAAEIVKANNTNNMILGTSWVGGVAPGLADTAVFNDTFTSLASAGTGGAISWNGMKVIGTNNPGQILVNNTTTANSLQTGSGGIDMTSAPRDVTIASFNIGGSQTWNVAAGRKLSIGKSTSDGHEKITGGTGSTVTIAGGGIVLMEGNGAPATGGSGGGGKNHNANLIVQSGATLQVTSGTAIGTATGTTTIQNGGSLVLSVTGINMQGEQFTVAGTGVGGLGVIQNNSGAQLQSAFDKVILAGDSTFASTTRFDIRDATHAGVVSLDLAGFTLTKKGADVLYLDGCTISSGDIVVEQGEMGFQNGVIVAAAAGDLVTVKNSASLRFWRSVSGFSPCVFDRDVTIEDGGAIRWNGNNTADEVDQRVDSPVSISGTATFEQATSNGSVFEIAGAITGTGAANITGLGILRLSGTNTYSGPTDIQSGTTQLNGSLAGVLTIASGATVSGNGSANGLVTANGNLHLNGTAGATGGLTATVTGNVNPAGPGVVGSLQTAALSLNDTTLSFDSTGEASTDSIIIAANGAFSATGITDVGVSVQGGWQIAQYPLIHYSGTTVPPNASPATYLNLLTSLGHASGQLVDTGSKIALNITAAPSTKWNGNVGPDWDLLALNWQSTDHLYLEGDAVVFDDSAAGNFNINLDATVLPGTVTFSNSANDYTLSSALNTGLIGGAATSLVKNGTRTATLSTANTYGGGTVINNGTLALLATTETPTPSLGSGTIAVNAPGVFHVGINGTLANEITGDGAVVKAHPTDSTFTTFSGNNSYTGTTVVTNGTLSIGSPTALGASTSGTTVQDSARLYIGDPIANNSTINEPVIFAGGPDIALPDFQTVNARTGIIFAGPVSLKDFVEMSFDASTSISFTNAAAISYSGTGTGADLEITGGGNPTISGALNLGTGSLVMDGTGTLTLGGAGNIYQNTTVNSGTLAVTGDASLGSGPGTVASGAILALSGVLNNPFSTPLTGDGMLLKSGAGNAELAATNNLTAGTRLDGGLLLFGSDSAFGNAQLHVNGGAAASRDANPRTVPNPVLLGTNPAFGDINGILNAPVTYTGNISFGGASRSVRTYSPTIWAGGSNGGTLNYKLGASTLTLQGTHDWTTAAVSTELRQGTMVVDGANVTIFDALRIMAVDAAATARLSIINGGSVTLTKDTANLRLGYAGGSTTATNIADIGGTLTLVAGGSGGKVLFRKFLDSQRIQPEIRRQSADGGHSGLRCRFQ